MILTDRCPKISLTRELRVCGYAPNFLIYINIYIYNNIVIVVIINLPAIDFEGIYARTAFQNHSRLHDSVTSFCEHKSAVGRKAAAFFEPSFSPIREF